ncbi:type IV secretory system conjugative DNA transfer family protein [Planosporangium sp. 12N6]|uniref:type IV secretory system conjugative DNA transfer family protein n=1 Tax=Planosporangium spinosum TaxID=3402278 RepID=UPI003CF78406
MSPARASGPRDSGDAGYLVGGGALLMLIVAAAVWVPVTVIRPPGYHGGGLFVVAGDLIHGRIHWTLACSLVLAAELVLLAAVVTAVMVAWRRHRRRRSRVDDKARRMAKRADLASLSPQGVAESARRLRPSLAGADRVDPDDAGVLIGYTVAGGMELRQSWEDMAVDVWGPRSGKTTSRAIPAVVACPGPTLVTSTKGDIVDATRDPRATRGRVWVFDPQDIIGGAPQMWWNPLAGLTTITDARRLADHFAAAERPPGATADAFFDPMGAELAANLLLAAAVAGRTVIDAYRWSVSPRDEEPAVILAEHGYPLPSESVRGVLNMPDRTRGSVYATCQKLLICLTEPAVTRWVTPPDRPGVPEFDPVAFVSSTDTIYLLSEGGPGSPAPLVAAITDAVLRAGAERARTRPGRRLDPALLAVLDEAANICRLRQLPSQYSFFGSAGLAIITILQSYAQGVEVWGREGMRKLWSSANVRTYGGGVADPDFLEELSKLIGETDVMVRSTTTSGSGWGDRSVSHQPQRRRILDVADLHALPRGRMVVYSSGNPPVLARTQPWQHGPHAAAIRASLARWDPSGQYDTALDPQPVPAGDPDDLSPEQR